MESRNKKLFLKKVIFILLGIFYTKVPFYRKCKKVIFYIFGIKKEKQGGNLLLFQYFKG